MSHYSIQSPPSPMDHRIIVVAQSVILLDRLDDDTDWQVIISCYVAKEFRYDEWAHFNTIACCQEFIQAFGEENATAFLQRARNAFTNRNQDSPQLRAKSCPFIQNALVTGSTNI